MLDNKKISLTLILFLSISMILVSTPTVLAYNGTITYDSSTKYITVLGGSTNSQVSFNDIYLADVANNWGVVTKLAYNQFKMNAYLKIGNGTTPTYFCDKMKQITFTYPSGVAWASYPIIVYANAYFTLGEIINSTLKTTTNGCSLILELPDGCNAGLDAKQYSQVSLYDSSFKTYRYDNYLIGGCQFVFTGYIKNIWNCIFEYTMNYAVRDAQFFNCLYEYSRNDGVFLVCTNCTYNYVRFYHASIDYKIDGSTTIRNGYSRGNSYYTIVQQGGNSNPAYFIDCDFDKWTIYINNPAYYIYRQYTLSLTVLNGNVTDFVENATVTLHKGSQFIGQWITNSSGQIDTQILTYGYYDNTGTLKNSTEPFYLNIMHKDWANYTSRFYVYEPTKMTVSLQEKPQEQPTVTPTPQMTKQEMIRSILSNPVAIICIIAVIVVLMLIGVVKFRY